MGHSAKGCENSATSKGLPNFEAELVSLKVDVIVAGGTLAPLAAMRATQTIPIVLGAAGAPVETGLVSSLAKPGRNVTGLSNHSADLTGKRLQLLKEIVPGITRVAVLWNAANSVAEVVFRETEAAAHMLVKYLGMTPMETLISATRWGGQIMMCKDLGEIREGWLADLLLVDGDPLANISILQDKSKLLAIMKDGQFAKPPEIRSSRSRFVA